MTPLLKTGTRKYRLHYSLLVNGERHEKEVELEGQSEKFAENKLKSMIANDLVLEIHSTIRVK